MPSKCPGSNDRSDRVVKKTKTKWFVTATGESSTGRAGDYTIRETDSLLHVIAKTDRNEPLELEEGFDVPTRSTASKKKRKLTTRRQEAPYSTSYFEVSSVRSDTNVQDNPNHADDDDDEVDLKDDDDDNRSDNDGENDATNGDMSETDSSSHDERPAKKLKQMKKGKDEECSKRQIQFFKLENKDMYIVLMPSSTSLPVLGKIQVTFLHGDVNVFGYTMNESSGRKTFDLYSPRRCMSLNLTSNLPKTPLTVDALKTTFSTKGFKLSDGDLTRLLSSIDQTDSVLLLTRLTSSFTSMLTHYYNELDLFYERQIATSSSSSPIERELKCILDVTTSQDRKLFTLGKDWKKIKARGCTVVCGGKGVGKSTMLKYLINSTLTQEEAVLCLDFDPGQAEITSPGCLSAAVIRSPLLGPNFTHVIKPEKMVYLGDVSVGLDPSKYMKSVRYIVGCCRGDPELSRMPWFVNTMGFNKGIGLDIMVNILRLVRPDVVVQIYSAERARNYEYQLTPSIVEYLKVVPLSPVEPENLAYDFYRTSSCARHKGIGFQIGFKPSDIRELMMLSYFSQLVTFPYWSLNAVRPRSASISKLSFVVSTAISPSDIFKVFNGNLVALCSMQDLKCEVVLESVDVDYAIGIKPEFVPCFGLGIVRCVDVKEMKIYVITHLSDDEMTNVDCLVVGNLGPPASIYNKQLYVDGPTAYMEVRGFRNVQSLKRSFRYFPRTNTAGDV